MSMLARAKRGLRRVLPRQVVSALPPLATAQTIEFSGDYVSWEEAQRACAEGWEAPNILAKVRNSALKVKRGEAAFERDSVAFAEPDHRWPLLTCLLCAALRRNKQKGIEETPVARAFLRSAFCMLYDLHVRRTAKPERCGPPEEQRRRPSGRGGLLDDFVDAHQDGQRRIYATADGESHFDEVEIPTSPQQVHSNAAVFEVSANYAATRIRFTRIPSGAGQVDWHTVSERVLTVRLDGSAEYQTSDGDERHVPAGGFVLFEDTHGKGHKSRHSPEEQTVIWINLPRGLEHP